MQAHVPADNAPTRTQRRATTILLWLLVLGFGAMLAWLGIARHLAYNTRMSDLGLMSQAIWSATQGRPLIMTSEFGHFSRLGGHVELIYFLLAVPYAFWPDPRTLIILQAALYALGALPVAWMTQRRVDHPFAVLGMALVYLLYPMAQTSVLWDIHGDTLAMPLLLFAFDALDRRAWLSYGIFLALSLASKFYVALPVAILGACLLLWSDKRRAGAFTLAAGIGYGLLAFFVIRPTFATHASGVEEVAGSYINYYFGELATVGETLIPRILHGLVVFGPAAVLVWRGWPWLLPGLPIAAATLISTGPGPAYDSRYHHYALVVPFLMLAMIEALRWLQQRQQARAAEQPPRRSRRTWHGDLTMTLLLTLFVNILVVNTPLSPFFWQAGPDWFFDSTTYHRMPRDAVKDAFLAEHVPPRAPVVASTTLGTHIINRDVLYEARHLLSPDSPEGAFARMLGEADYVVSDALLDHFAGGAGTANERVLIGRLLRHPDFTLTEMRDGLLFFERHAAPEEELAQQIAVEQPASLPPADISFGPQIGLVSHNITPLDPGERRYRATFTWRAGAAAAPSHNAIAISRLEGVPNARIVHLPTYALHPPPQWQPGELIRETFEVELPADLAPGTYTWRVGWYDLQSEFAANTDERSLLPGSTEVALDRIHVVE
jgi:uncharacterized membrane protein